MGQIQRAGRGFVSSQVRVGLLQMKSEPSPAKNLQKALRGIDEAAQKGATVVCLEELFLTPYFPQTESAKHFKLAEPVPGPTTRALAEAARKHKVVVLGSIFEKRADGIYHNSAVLIDARGKLLGKYRKMHIPDDPGFYEKFYFTPGDLGFQSFSTPHGRIGMLVCWDQWFPEAARLTALSGAQILVYPTAIGWAAGESPKVRERQQTAWELIQRSHAVANGVFVCAVNRVGREGKIKFWGSSFVADPFGGLVAKAGPEREEILIADCDLSKIRQTREDWPFLRDRRIDAYGALSSRFLDTRT